jgi:hypothetical protein
MRVHYEGQGRLLVVMSIFTRFSEIVMKLGRLQAKDKQRIRQIYSQWPREESGEIGKPHENEY